jgi:Xaa-Pro aminopeptidase
MPGAPESRVEHLAGAVEERELDALIVGDLVHPGDSGRDAMADVTWLTGFAGTSGLAVVGARMRAFVTDFRYAERAEGALPAGFELLIAERSLSETVATELRGRVGFDPRATSVRELRRLRERAAEDVELIETEGVVEELRRVKDGDEIEAIAAAAELTDAVYAELEQDGICSRTEREVGLWIERRMRELGASGPAFPPIVAAGPNGSLPHAEPGERVIAEGDLVVVDIGAILDGYCSDCTRTYACGEVGAEEREVYELALAAQRAALNGIRDGASGRDVDAIARDLIGEGGHGERFGHGLGHGVGISVHEPPRLSRRSEDDLTAGDVVTVEPGIYVPGRFGVRIEDLVLVTEDGCRNLSGRPKSLTSLA